MPPAAFTVSCLFTMVRPFCCAVIVTCHVPLEPSSPLPSYRPASLSEQLTTVFIAAIPIAGMAGMKKLTVTCAPVIGAPLSSVSFTRKMLLPVCGGDGSEVSDTLTAAELMAAAPPAPGGGGMYAPAAACN